MDTPSRRAPDSRGRPPGRGRRQHEGGAGGDGGRRSGPGKLRAGGGPLRPEPLAGAVEKPAGRANLRAEAAGVLGEVLDHRQSLKRLLQERQARLVREEDRALLRELASGVVRHLPLLDWVLDDQTERGLADTQAELRHILRVGAFQLLFLDRVPAYAAVDQCVEAAKAVRPGAGGFVNGILRGVAERRDEAGELPYRLNGGEGAALRLGMPEWLAQRYLARFGEAAGEDLMEAFQAPAPTNLVFPSPSARAQGLPLLRREGIVLEPDAALPLTYAVRRGNPVETEAFRRGHFYIMDPASQVPALLLPVEGSTRVLDLCAAPGGKTVLLSGRVGERGWVLSTDVHRRRLAQIAENVRRLGLTNVRLAQVDLEAGLPFRPEWPAVLLDAPCSSLGTLRRNPEIRWQIQESDLAFRADRQFRFLTEAARAVSPGGVLCYSVCSIEPEETEAVAERFLAENAGFSPQPCKPPKPLAEILDSAGSGRFTCLPHRHSWDGFFIALFRRHLY